MNALRAISAGMLAAASAVLGGASKLAELGARRLAPRADVPEPAPYTGGTVFDAEADADAGARLDVTTDQRVDVTTDDLMDVTADDLVTAADFAAELDIDDPLLTGDVRGEVAGDAVVADDALDALVSEAMEGAGEPLVGDDAALEDTVDAVLDAVEVDDVTPPPPSPPAPVDDDTAADVPARDFGVVRADELATAALDDAVLGDDGAARTYESHIAELADRNVAAVVREIQDLSTGELGQLFDYESAHRKRKTVLQAIERAAAPDDDSART